MQPVQIKIIGNKDLYVKWDDNSELLINFMKLRKLCPCATCASAREEQSETFIPIFSGNQIKVKSIQQVGSYAISIHWKDGHNTGIYTYEYLQELDKGQTTEKKQDYDKLL